MNYSHQFRTSQPLYRTTLYCLLTLASTLSLGACGPGGPPSAEAAQQASGPELNTPKEQPYLAPSSPQALNTPVSHDSNRAGAEASTEPSAPVETQSNSPEESGQRTAQGVESPPSTARGPVPSETEPAPSKEAWIHIAPGDVIEYYGDSTVYGNLSGVGTQVPRPAPRVFSEMLNNKYIVRNEGVSATTSTQLLLGTDGKHLPWDLQMDESKARVVIINHAMNDKVYTPVALYKNNLRQLADVALKRGKQVIFETPNPDRWGGLEPYMAAMKSVAAEFNIPVIDQYAYLMDYLNGRPVTLIAPDNTHPSEEAYEMKGRFAAKMFLEFTDN